MRCAVFGCNSSYHSNRVNNGDVKFFRFPTDTAICNSWKIACCRKDKFNTKTSRVCSKHFKKDDYQRNLKYELLQCSVPKTIRLIKPEAIPNENLPKSSSFVAKSSTSERQGRIAKRNRSKLVDDILKERMLQTVNMDTVKTTTTTTVGNCRNSPGGESIIKVENNKNNIDKPKTIRLMKPEAILNENLPKSSSIVAKSSTSERQGQIAIRNQSKLVDGILKERKLQTVNMDTVKTTTTTATVGNCRNSSGGESIIKVENNKNNIDKPKTIRLNKPEAILNENLPKSSSSIVAKSSTSERQGQIAIRNQSKLVDDILKERKLQTVNMDTVKTTTATVGNCRNSPGGESTITVENNTNNIDKPKTIWLIKPDAILNENLPKSSSFVAKSSTAEKQGQVAKRNQFKLVDDILRKRKLQTVNMDTVKTTTATVGNCSNSSGGESIITVENNENNVDKPKTIWLIKPAVILNENLPKSSFVAKSSTSEKQGQVAKRNQFKLVDDFLKKQKLQTVNMDTVKTTTTTATIGNCRNSPGGESIITVENNENNVDKPKTIWLIKPDAILNENLPKSSSSFVVKSSTSEKQGQVAKRKQSKLVNDILKKQKLQTMNMDTVKTTTTTATVGNCRNSPGRESIITVENHENNVDKPKTIWLIKPAAILNENLPKSSSFVAKSSTSKKQGQVAKRNQFKLIDDYLKKRKLQKVNMDTVKTTTTTATVDNCRNSSGGESIIKVKNNENNVDKHANVATKDKGSNTEVDNRDNIIAELKKRIQFLEYEVEASKKLFSSKQMKKLKNPERRVRWSIEDISKATVIYSAGPQTYRLLLKNGYPFPTIATIRSCLRKKVTK